MSARAKSRQAQSVLVSRNGPICRITMNRPEKLNALNTEIRDGLATAIGALVDDATARVVVIEGAGRAFSAGADLGANLGGGERDWHARRIEAGKWQRLLADLEALPQATVAKVQGHCIGGAMLLALACDLRVGSDDVKFSIPEVAIGIPLTWAGLPRLVREIGVPRARDLVMTGRVIAADEALAWGAIQRLVALGDLDQATDALVSELLAMPAGPLAMTRAALSAIGRSTSGAEIAWADPDLLAWSTRDPEMREAAARYWGERRK